MKKKLILLGVLVLALTVNVGCQKQDIGDAENEEEPSITESEDKENGEAENIEEDEMIKWESDTIDFSKVEYKSSETQRDEDLEESIIGYLDYNKDEDGKLVYYYNNIDLNGDGNDEIFTYLIGTAVSGSGGSTALIIDGENYDVISNFTLVQNPVLISENKTNGWNDIIMQVSGGGAESSYVKMQFDGDNYPSNPSLAPELDESSAVIGTAILSNSVSIEDGLEIK